MHPQTGQRSQLNPYIITFFSLFGYVSMDLVISRKTRYAEIIDLYSVFLYVYGDKHKDSGICIEILKGVK